MVTEPWTDSVQHTAAVSSMAATTTVKTKTKKKKDQKLPRAQECNQKDTTIGILSFEVANAMSKAVHLHKSLSDLEISRLRNEILKSHAVRMLVSTDEQYLLELALAEKLDELNRVAAVVSRLGKRCSEQALIGFEHVYCDLLSRRIEVGKLGFLARDMEGTVKKMERYVNSAANLYGELGTLNELEQGAKKFHLAQQHHEETRRVFEQKLQWQRHDVKHLRESSLWNQSYDKIVGLMARAVCTLYARIVVVFGESTLALEALADESKQLSRQMGSTHQCHQSPHTIQLHNGATGTRPRPILARRHGVGMRGEGANFLCGSNPGKLFMECLSLSSSSSWEDADECSETYRGSSTMGASPALSASFRQTKHGRHGRTRFGPKSSILTRAPPSSVGGSALALHYANIIIIIEKLLQHPHLVGEEARDDLYQMLPLSLRTSLRRNLKSYVKNLAIYDAPLAHDWKAKLEKILSWLAPLAHNMIRWQTEHNFEQQQIVLRTSVLLLQTIYFADREKTEVAISELLVGLNYICRYEHQQSALLDCGSSMDFDDGLDWQLQY